MDVADILDTYVYRLGINNMQYSYSSAINLFQNLLSLALVIITHKVIKRMGEEGIV